MALQNKQSSQASLAASLLALPWQVLRLRRSEWWRAARIRRYQAALLVDQLRFAVTEIPYYRDLGIDAENINSPADLARFPLLNKSVVQRESGRLRNPQYLKGRVHSSTTSGSSGQPTTTWFDPRTWMLTKYALKARRTLAAGTPLGQRLMIFDETSRPDGRIPPPTFTRLPFFRQVRLSTFVQLDEQLSILTGFRPTVIYASPSAITELLDYAERQGISAPRVGTVFLSSEFLTADSRHRIGASLHCRVIDIYGSTEFKEVAVQCDHGNYHVNFESVYVETIPDEDLGEERIVITSLRNRAMPLVRMDMGDTGRLAWDACSCGRESPYLQVLSGRQLEYLCPRDGSRVSPYLLTTHIEAVPGVGRYRFVQHADGCIELLVVPRHDNEDRESTVRGIEQAMRRLLGPGNPFAIRLVESIERTPAGKHRLVTRAS